MSLSDYTPGYIALFASCVIDPAKLSAIDATIARITVHGDRYKAVETASGVPWFVVALIHNLECDLSFLEHLHNGDSLSRPTVHDPANRPPGWTGKGTWEESALDALQYDRLTKISQWDLPQILFALETFNGFGYRSEGINSPYLWAGSNHYTRGKFIRDHVFDRNAVSDQLGSAAILFRMVTRRMNGEIIVALKGEQPIGPLETNEARTRTLCETQLRSHED